MTDAQAVAKALFDELEKARDMDYEGSALNTPELVAMLTTTLDAKEREVWEKVANKLEEQYNDSWAYSTLVEEFINWCRRQGGGG